MVGTLESESPLVTYDAKGPQQSKLLLEQIKSMRSSSGSVEFSHFLTRKDRTFAITRSDQQVYWNHGSPSSNCCKVSDNRRVYLVAASNGHVMFLVDRINGAGGVAGDNNEENSVIHQLPNGHSYKVPKYGSVVGLHLYGDKGVLGKDVMKLNETQFHVTDDNFNKPQQNYALVMRDVEKCLTLNDELVVYMTCGGYTSCFLTNHGRLLIGGANAFGALGLSNNIGKTEEILVHPIHSQNPSLFFCKVVCGDHSIFAITKEGLVYVSGYNASNELGLKGVIISASQLQPSILFNEFASVDPFIDVACQYYGAILLGKSGSVYVSGGDVKHVRKHSPSVLDFSKFIQVGSTNNSLFAISHNGSEDILLTRFTRDSQNVFNHTQRCSHFDPTKNVFAITGSEYSTMTCVVLGNEVRNSKLQSNLLLHLTTYNSTFGKTFCDLIIRN